MSTAAAWDLAPAPGRPGRHLQVVPAHVAPGRTDGGLRLTRRGRLALTVLVVALLAIAALSARAGSTGSAGRPIDHPTTVRAGQTMSEIAAHELPALPVQEGVWAIQLANNLSSTEVAAGQVLLIPALGRACPGWCPCTVLGSGFGQAARDTPSGGSARRRP